MNEKPMQPWQNQLHNDPIPALLAAENKAIVYFTRRELLNEKVEPIERVWELTEPQKILKKQQEDGSWKGTGQNKDIYPPNHHTLVETFKKFQVLVEQYAFTNKHPAIQKAAEYLFSCQTPEGDIRGFIANQYAPYYTGFILSMLIIAGYKDDPRVEKGLNWLLSMRQTDGGWTIPLITHKLDRETQYRLTSQFAEPVQLDRNKPFSHNWTDMALRGFIVHPIYRKFQGIVAAGRLLKSSLFQPDNYTSYQHPDYWTRFTFWWPNLLTALESLRPLRFSKDDPDIKKALDWFIENQQPDGLWKIDQYKEITPKDIEAQLWLGLRICRMLKKYFG
jgi:hypothetical protein